jgi:hypothetical protein
MDIALVYAVYLAVSIGLTVIVASALSRSGRVYLAHAFGGDEGMARAVNRMLVVGFCLLSLGYAALTMRTSGHIAGAGQAVEVLSVKVGEELLVLGALQLVNMMFFARFRRPGGRPGAPAAGRRGAASWPGAAAGQAGTAAPGWAGAAMASGRPGAAGSTVGAAGPEGVAGTGLAGATGPSAPGSGASRAPGPAPGVPADPAARPAAPAAGPAAPAAGPTAPPLGRLSWPLGRLSRPHGRPSPPRGGLPR